MKWLHISDLHIDNSYPNDNDPKEATFYESFFEGLNKRISENSVDFIIFTGDLFNHGKWNKGQKEAALRFLGEVYKACSKQCGWNWKLGDQMDRLFYCPGNHDVFRNAYLVNKDDSFVILRNNLLEAVSEQKNPFVTRRGHFCNQDKGNALERQVFTEHTFSLFHKAMRDFGKYWSGDHDEFLYEFRKFALPDDSFLKSAVIGLNTALLAGQSYSPDEITKELETAWAEMQTAHAKLNFGEAQKAYERYQNAYMKRQGLWKNDEKHLCFISQDASNALEEALQEQKCQYPVLFGHHPISFYSKDAQSAFYGFAKNVQAQVYLCGHTHKPTVTPLHYEGGVNEKTIYEVRTGGIFPDKTGYNEASFAIEEFQYDQTPPELTVSIYTYIHDPLVINRWIESTGSCKLQEFQNPTPKNRNLPDISDLSDEQFLALKSQIEIILQKDNDQSANSDPANRDSTMSEQRQNFSKKKERDDQSENRDDRLLTKFNPDREEDE